MHTICAAFDCCRRRQRRSPKLSNFNGTTNFRLSLKLLTLLALTLYWQPQAALSIILLLSPHCTVIAMLIACYVHLVISLSLPHFVIWVLLPCHVKSLATLLNVVPYVGRGGAQSIFTRLPHCSDVDVDANVSVSVDASLPWQLRAMTVSLSLLLYVSVVVSALVVVFVVVVVIVVKSRPATPVCVLGWQPLPALLSPYPCLLLSFLPCCHASYRKFTCAFMCARCTCFCCYCICCLPASQPAHTVGKG